MMNDLPHFTPGCTYVTTNPKTLEIILKTGKFLHIKTYYEKKKWWQFWKRKKPILYELMCIKDLEN